MGLVCLRHEISFDKGEVCIKVRKILDFVGLQGSLEDKARNFAEKGTRDTIWAFNNILGFMHSLKERVVRKEITAGTIRNYVKSIKLFCQMADISIAWDKITRGLPRGRRYAEDRAPTLEEIKKLVDYPDRRIKPVVYTMVSSGVFKVNKLPRSGFKVPSLDERLEEFRTRHVVVALRRYVIDNG